MANRAYNTWLKKTLSHDQKREGLSDAAPLFSFRRNPLPLADTAQVNAYDTPFAPLHMVAGAGFSARRSMSTTGFAQYVPQQTRQTLDGFGAGVGPIDFGELQNLSPQSQSVGIYTPTTAMAALTQKSGGA